MRLSSLLSVARPPLRTIGPLSDLQYCKSILPGCSVRPRPRACSQLKASYRCKNGHKKALLAPRGQPTCFGIVEPPSSTVVHTRLDYFSRRTRWRDVCVRPRERARCLLPARCLLRCWCSPRPRDHRRCGAYRLVATSGERVDIYLRPLQSQHALRNVSSKCVVCAPHAHRERSAP